MIINLLSKINKKKSELGVHLYPLKKMIYTLKLLLRKLERL